MYREVQKATLNHTFTFAKAHTRNEFFTRKAPSVWPFQSRRKLGALDKKQFTSTFDDAGDQDSPNRKLFV